MRHLLAIAAAALGTACLQGVELDQKVFPCRAAADCIEGNVCHPTRFVCVAVGTATVSDGGPPAAPRDAAPAPDASADGDAAPALDAADSGPADTGGPGGIGDRCTEAPNGRCAEGTCVDGVCCKEPCDGLCERCDVTPGECTPVQRGRDPANECPDLDCATLTHGLEGGTCYAYRAETRASTCDGERACTRASCADAERGEAVAVCIDVGCVAQGACPPGRPVSDFDSPAELCGGSAQVCQADRVDRGCCSATGRCCPVLICEMPPSQLCP